jgi:hypothetical protein
MKIVELRQLILKKSETLQKPKYVILSNQDYLELKEEARDLCRFLCVEKKDTAEFNGVKILPESEIVDLRPVSPSFWITNSTCNTATNSTASYVCAYCPETYPHIHIDKNP